MPAKMKKASYKKGGSKKMNYGGSKKSMYKKGGSKPDFLDFDKDGNTTEPMKSAYMYGGMKRKEIGGPMYTDQGMQIPGMRSGGGLEKAQKGKNISKIGKKIKNLFTKQKPITDNLDTDVSKLTFKGINRAGEKTFKIGVKGKEFPRVNNVQDFVKMNRKFGQPQAKRFTPGLNPYKSSLDNQSITEKVSRKLAKIKRKFGIK